MRPLFLAVAALAVLPHLAHAQVPSAAAVKFGPGPDFLPKAVEFALIQGDPSKPGVYTVRLRFPNNFQFPAHWHPTDEHVTVLQGTFIVGMGDAIDVAKGQTLTAGGFITAPADAHHWATTRGVTVVQVSGEGPFAITYVKASDDPRQAQPTR
jgi:quercetin dioxygenase-like cupin family protein